MWIVDQTAGELREAYETLTTEPYQPLFVELWGVPGPAPADGFGADADGGLTVERLGRAVHEGRRCEEDPTGFVLRGTGNEPPFSVVVAEPGIVLTQIGMTLEFPYEPPIDQDGARIYRTELVIPPRSLSVEFVAGRCVDSMSGAWSDYRVSLTVDDANYTGCGYSGRGADASGVSYRIATVDETLDGCGADGREPCGWFRFDYPRFEAGLTVDALQAINDTVGRFVETPMRRQRPPATPPELVERWSEDYRSFKQQFPESSQRWTVRRTATVVSATATLVNLEFSEQAYTGGAHANRRVELLCLDGQSGERLALEALLVDGALEQLTAIAERRFREIRGIPAEADLLEAGFQFADNRFSLPEDFVLTPTTLRFHYDAYDIASYATGPTTVTLGRRSIEPMLRPEYRRSAR